MPDSVTYVDFKEVQFRLECQYSQKLFFSKSHHFTTPPLGKELSSFCLLKQGSVTFFTEDGNVEGTAGDFFYVPDGIHYRSEWKGNPEIEFINIHFRFAGTRLEKYTPDINQISRPLDQQIALQRIDALCDFKMTELMESLLPYDRNVPTEQLMLLSILYRIFSLSYPYLKKRRKTRRLDAIEPAITYIESNYMRSDPISLYAGLCHLSESRFHHLFREYMKWSPVEYRNMLRVHRASYMLSESTQSIEEISNAIGFESSIYFRRVFKYFYGLSPGQFRKRTKVQFVIPSFQEANAT